MKRRGFTLIELLAVIIILSVVAVIGTPIVVDVIDDARKSADRSSVHMVLAAANNYYAESWISDREGIDGKTDIYEKLSMENKPENGSVVINEQGQVALSLVMNKTCYVKTYSGDIEEYEEGANECRMETVLDKDAPLVTIKQSDGVLGNNGWYVEAPFYIITLNDQNGSGPDRYEWCTGFDCEPKTVEYTNGSQKTIGLDSTNTQICVIGIDKKENRSKKECSNLIQLDTKEPTIDISGPIYVSLNEEIDLMEGVNVSDEISGLEGSLSIDPSTIDTSYAEEYIVEYIIYDKAGNRARVERKVEVSPAGIPSIIFSPTTSEKGWAKEDFYVTVGVSDLSGRGIKEIKICTSSGKDSCDITNGATITEDMLNNYQCPEGIEADHCVTREIVMEDSMNIICVETTDKYGQTNQTCSGTYKLDKTNPTPGRIKINGSEQIKEWYTEDVTIEVINGEDELSGHLETTIDVEKIDYNTEGKVVTVKTVDKAGNVSTREYTIKVDKTKPEVTITEPSINGQNGWYITTPTITATITDTYSTLDKIKWCEGTNCEPTEEYKVSTKSVTVEDTKGTQICVIGIDKAGNVSETVCSNVIKVDTKKPYFSGLDPIPVEIGEEIDLDSGVSVNDVTSLVDGTYEIVSNTIEEGKRGTYEVVYYAKDIAGNDIREIRTVSISADVPEITFSPTAKELGWSKEEFTVTINAKDNSGHGIKQMYICTITSDECDPMEGSLIKSSTATRDIVIESNNNRICVIAEDNSGQVSPKICSDAYKLDMSKPTPGTIQIEGTKGKNDWYTSNVTINKVDGSDGLSGHLETVVNIKGITENTKGKDVIVTTQDVAGNTNTRTYTIKVDKTKPNCSMSTLSYIGVGKTATVEVTCTNTISGIEDVTLSSSNFVVNNAEIISVNKSTVTNGYKYTVTLRGTSAGTFAMKLLSGSVSTVAGLTNDELSSGTITVTSLELTPNTGTTYVGGSSLTSTISGSNAGTITCSSSSNAIATCSVSNSTLTVTPVSSGNATITVTGSNGGATATYNVTVKAVTLSVEPNSGTVYVGGNSITTTIKGSNYKNLSCESSDSTKATCSISGTTLTVTPVAAGNIKITVSETNANKKAEYSVTVIKPTLTLTPTSGTLYVNGSNVTSTIGGTNYGTLSCKSSDETKAKCSITGTTLTIIPVAVGTPIITVEESNGRVTAKYTATVVKPTLQLSETSGTVYNGGSNKTVTVSGTNYGNLSCRSSNESYAKCSISGNTLTVIPGTSAGTATITVEESNGKVTTTYTATNKIPTVSLSPTSGTTYVGGSNLTSTITKTDAGNLSCKSSNENVAKCSISGTTLTMTPQSVSGSAVITVTESNGNKTAKYTFNNMIEDYQVGVKYEVIDGTINSNGWSKADLTVKVTLTDTPGTGLKSFNLCTATTNTCDPTTGSSITGTTAERDIVIESANNRICIQATDNYGRKSSVICSDAYKLDKTAPTAGTIKVNNATPSTNWYNSALTITAVDGSDNTNGSGHASTTTNVSSISSNTSGTTVRVTTTDLAGNSSTRDYTLKLDTTTPNVSIAKTSGSTKLTATVSNASSIISGTTYQWYKGTSAISGATSSTYTPTTGGTYSVKVTTRAGKTGTSNEITINSYTVSYNMNGGTGSIAAQTKVEDIALTLSSTIPTRDGYTFMGWGSSATDTSKDYDKGVTYTSNSGTTLFAIWKKTVTVTFNANGASLSSTNSKVTCSGTTCTTTCDMYNAATSCTVTAPKITRSDFTITGFNTSSSATTSQVASEGTATVSANTTYYAITSKEVTVTFYRNNATSITPSGGSASTAISLTQSCTIRNSATTCNITSPTITAPSATPTVVGWDATSSYTSNEWSVNTAKAFNSNASYYAVTKKDAVTHSITYAKTTGVNAIGATTGSCNIAATYNGTAQNGSCSITLPTITASTGYTASGWYNSSNTKLGNASASVSVSASQTITAKATANSYTCSAGQYLGASATSCTQCQSGYYCPGGTYTFSSSLQGRSTCPSGYGTSPVGSDAQTDCYKTVTVSYAGNGATSGSTSSQTCNAYYNNGSCSITPRANGFLKTGNTFQGWGTGTTSVTHNPGTSYSFSVNTTLYAVWTPTIYKLTINPNGGTMYYNDSNKTSSSFTISFKYGYNRHLGTFTSGYYGNSSTVGLPIKSGYSFEGWKVTSGGGTVTYYSTPGAYGYKNDDFTGTSRPTSWPYYLYNGNYAGDVTITAQWKSTITPDFCVMNGSSCVSNDLGTYNGLTRKYQISGVAYGNITCTSSNSSIATCSVTNSILSVTGHNTGNVTITLTESNAGIQKSYKLNSNSTTYCVTTCHNNSCSELLGDNNYGSCMGQCVSGCNASQNQCTIEKCCASTAASSCSSYTGSEYTNCYNGTLGACVAANQAGQGSCCK